MFYRRRKYTTVSFIQPEVDPDFDNIDADLIDLQHEIEVHGIIELHPDGDRRSNDFDPVPLHTRGYDDKDVVKTEEISVDPSELKIGDQVIVDIPNSNSFSRSALFTGVLVGESKDKQAWSIIKEGTKRPRHINKSFCRKRRVYEKRKTIKTTERAARDVA
jgi:hypothetical protein